MELQLPNADKPRSGLFSDLAGDYQRSRAQSSSHDWIGVIVRGLAPLLTPATAIFLAIILAGTLLVSINSESIYAHIAIPVLVAGAALVWCSSQTVVDPRWLALALTLEETLPYVNLIPIDPHTRWFIRYPLLIAFCVPAAPRVLKSGFLKRGHFPLVLIYFAWAIISLIYSEDPATSAGRLFPAILIVLAAILIASLVSDSDDLTTVFSRFFLGCSFLAGLAALTATVFPVKVLMEGEEVVPIGVYNWISDESSGLLRFSGYSYTPNDIGALMLVTVGVGLVIWPRYKGLRRFGIAIVMLSTMIFAAMADSRSPFIALGVGVSIFLVWRYRWRGLVLVGALAICALTAYQIYGLRERDALTRDVSTLTGRTEAWKFELSKIAERPLTGYGYSVEGAIFQDRTFPNWDKFWDLGPNTSVHNSYMSVVVGLGFPALILFLYIMVTPWTSLFRRDDGDPWRLRPVFFFIALPAFIVGLDETGLADPRYLKGIIFFICWALAERQRLEAEEAHQREFMSNHSTFATIIGGVVVLMAIVLGTSRALASDYYVDAANGNDSYSGKSTSNAWKTLSKVDHFPFQAGDVVHMARGSVWREVLKPAVSDDSNFRGVTFTAYGNGDFPTINGSDVVTGWSPSGGQTYSAPLTQPVYNVFVDGEPGWGLAHACCLSSDSCAPTNPKTYTKGQTCTLGPMRPGSWYSTGSQTAAGTLYVWLPSGSNPSSHSIEAVSRPFGVVANPQGRALDGLTLDHLQIVQSGLRGISLVSQDAAGCCGSRGIGNGSGIRGLVIRSCVLKRIGTGPIDDGQYGNAITLINATAPLVENNVVSYAGNHGNCINVQNSNDARVTGNRVDHWNHNGIDIKGSHDVIVEGNVAEGSQVGAGFYTEFSDNVVFRNNQATDVSNGFQISAGATASVVDNLIRSAKTIIYFGPRSVSLNASNNRASLCQSTIGRDGSGNLVQVNNSWR